MNHFDTVGRYTFLAEPFHCDFSSRLFLSHLGNHLLNAADFHAHERGFGMTVLQPMHKTWVLSRFAIEMKEIPLAYDKFEVETWIEQTMKWFTYRNFSVLDREGKVYGYGRSVWALIDTDTRQPTDILAFDDGRVKRSTDVKYLCPIDAVSRVKMTDNIQRWHTLVTTYSDVDMNGHINSVKYIEHLLNLWSMTFHATHPIKRIDVAYVAEAYGGDTLHFDVETLGELTYAVRIVRQAKGQPMEQEVCRCKVQFTETLHPKKL